MLTGLQIQADFCLATAKVLVIVIARQPVHQFIRAICAFTEWRAINQNVVVTCIIFFRSGRRNAHARKPKLDNDRGTDSGPILYADKVHHRPVRRCGFLSHQR